MNRKRFFYLNHFIMISLTLLIVGTFLFIPISNYSSAINNYDVDLVSDDLEKDANRQTAAIYSIEIKNTGENDDTYVLSFSNPKTDTWVATFPDYISNTPEISVQVARSVFINFSVKPSCGCEEGNQNSVEITAISNNESSAIDKITVVTTYTATVVDPNGGGEEPPITDTDGDSFSDDDELYYGTDPYDPDDYPEKDTDKDGLSDDREKVIGTDPQNPDTDGDGDDDYKEYNQDTNPNDANDNSRTQTVDGDGANADDKSSKDSGFLGLNGGDDILFIIIPILIVIIVISLIILMYIWKAQDQKEIRGKNVDKLYEDDYDNFEDRERTKEKKGRDASVSDHSRPIETIKVKPEKTSEGYKCPECGKAYNMKSLRKHLLRKHRKRLK